MAEGFQTTVQTQPVMAVAGDFASGNPRFAVIAGPGGLIAGTGGLNVGLFAWFESGSPVDLDGTPQKVVNTGSGAPTGFVHREQQGLITTYLDNASQGIPAGFPVTLMSGGDFWVKNDGAGAATVGMKAMAKNADGTIAFAAAGAPPGGYTETKFYAMSAGAAGELIKISDHPLG